MGPHSVSLRGEVSETRLKNFIIIKKQGVRKIIELWIFSRTDVTGWTIQLGITRRHSYTYLGQKLKVKRVVSHPNYNLEVAQDNDVALFQVELSFSR